MAEPASHAHRATPNGALRTRAPGEHSRVTFFELFFDLVFVFAVTQLSHSFAGQLDLEGAAHTLLILLAVWWAWIYTTWATNWLDPDDVSVRLMLTGLMLAGLTMSAAIPGAFEERGLAFAVPYVAIQVGRTLFVLWAGRADDTLRRTFQRIAIWLGSAAILWIAGGFAEGNARLGLWAFALGIEYLAAPVGYRVPGLGRSATADWNIEGSHLAERCGLFIIIALGESLLVTGATFSGLEWNRPLVIAMVASFGAAVGMWWIYFDRTAEAGSDLIAHSEDPGRMARLAYTYIHLPIVAGIILTAVGDEYILSHPTGETEWRVALVILGGPAVFLLGHWLFKRAVFGHFVAPHTAGAIALVGALALYQSLSPWQLSCYATVVLVATAVWAHFAANRLFASEG